MAGYPELKPPRGTVQEVHSQAMATTRCLCLRPLRAGGLSVSPMAPGKPTRDRTPEHCPWSCSASPSPSGPEAVNPGTRPSLRSSSEPPTASWSVPEEPATSLSHPRQPLDVTDVGEGPCLSLLPFSAADTTLLSQGKQVETLAVYCQATLPFLSSLVRQWITIPLPISLHLLIASLAPASGKTK